MGVPPCDAIMGAQGRLLLLTFLWLDYSMQLANATWTSHQLGIGEDLHSARISDGLFSQRVKHYLFRSSEPNTDSGHARSHPPAAFYKSYFRHVVPNEDTGDKRRHDFGTSRSRNDVVVEEISPEQYQSLAATVGQQSRAATEQPLETTSGNRITRNTLIKEVKRKDLEKQNTYDRGPLPVGYQERTTSWEQNEKLAINPSTQTYTSGSPEWYSIDAKDKKSPYFSTAESLGDESVSCGNTDHRGGSGIPNLHDPESSPEGSASRDAYEEGNQYKANNMMDGYGLEKMAIDFFLNQGFKNPKEESEQKAAHSGGMRSTKNSGDQQFDIDTKTGTGLTLNNIVVSEGKFLGQGQESNTQYSRVAQTFGSFTPAGDSRKSPPVTLKKSEARRRSAADMDDGALYGLAYMNIMPQMLMQTAGRGDDTTGRNQKTAVDRAASYPHPTFRKNPSPMDSREMRDEDPGMPVTGREQPGNLWTDTDPRHGLSTASTEVRHMSSALTKQKCCYHSDDRPPQQIESVSAASAEWPEDAEESSLIYDTAAERLATEIRSDPSSTAPLESLPSAKNRFVEKTSRVSPDLATKQSSGPRSTGQHLERWPSIATSGRTEGERQTEQTTAATDNGQANQQTVLWTSQTSEEETNHGTNPTPSSDRRKQKHPELRELTQTGGDERTYRHRHPLLLHPKSPHEPLAARDTVYSHREDGKRIASADNPKRPKSSNTSPKEEANFRPYLTDFAGGIQALKGSFYKVVKRSAGIISHSHGHRSSKTGYSQPHRHWIKRSEHAPSRASQLSDAAGHHHTSHIEVLKPNHKLIPGPDTGQRFANPGSRFSERQPWQPKCGNSEKHKGLSVMYCLRARPFSAPKTEELSQTFSNTHRWKASWNSSQTPNTKLWTTAKRLKGYKKNCTPVNNLKTRLRSTDGWQVSQDTRTSRRHKQLKSWLPFCGPVGRRCRENISDIRYAPIRESTSMHPPDSNPNGTVRRFSKVTYVPKNRHRADFSKGSARLPRQPQRKRSVVCNAAPCLEPQDDKASFNEYLGRSHQKLANEARKNDKRAASHKSEKFKEDVSTDRYHKNNARYKRSSKTLQQACAEAQAIIDEYNSGDGPGHAAWCSVVSCSDDDGTVNMFCDGLTYEVRNQLLSILKEVSSGFPVIISCGDLCNNRCFCGMMSFFRDDLWSANGSIPLNITATVADNCLPHMDCHSGIKDIQSALKDYTLLSFNASTKHLQG